MISIIIPTFNEAENIEALIRFLNADNQKGNIEIIVVDGGSVDQTLQAAKKLGARVLLAPAKGRAAQMNYGAYHSLGDILYFVHADTFPAKSFDRDIQAAVAEGFEFGRYRTRFLSKKWILKANAFFTRYDLFICYGGDQTLFMTKGLFNKINGFNGEMLIMEDYDIVQRAKSGGKYKIMPEAALVSARKYNDNTWLQVQNANYRIVQMYKKGASQLEMVNRYRQMLNYRP